MTTSERPSRVFDTVTGVDGWRVAVDAVVPLDPPVLGAVAVPASKHERDGWGPTMTSELVERGIAVMRTDIRGRGDSREPRAMTSLPPGQLQRVVGDITAGLDWFVGVAGCASGSVCLLGEQDTADAVATVANADPRVGALVLVSPRLRARTVAACRADLPVCVLVSKDDRPTLHSAAQVYERSRHPHSRFRVVGDVGSGTTMFAAWQYLHAGEHLLERWIAAWAAAALRHDQYPE